MENLNDLTKMILSLDDIKTIIAKAIGNSVEIIDYQLKNLPGEKKGYCGYHYNLDIIIGQSDGNIAKHNFFAKVFPRDSVFLSRFLKLHKRFDREVQFFNKVAPLLLESYKGDAWAPKCYLANENIIVLENVKNKGYSIENYRSPFKGTILLSAARAQARLHAASLLAERRLGKHLKDVISEAISEPLFNEAHTPQNKLMIELVEIIAKKHGRNSRAVSTMFKRLYDKLNNNEGNNCVVCHGDTWCNNMMFDSSESKKCLLVDFQMSRYAERTYDLAQMIYFTNVELRDEEENAAIEAYHRELCEILKSNDPAYETPTLEDIRREYEDAKLYAFFACNIYYPALLLSLEEMQKIMQNPEDLFTKFVVKEDNESTLEIMKRDADYRERMTNIVLKLVDYCEKRFEENK